MNEAPSDETSAAPGRSALRLTPIDDPRPLDDFESRPSPAVSPRARPVADGPMTEGQVDRVDRVAVVVPARNEARNIAASIRSVRSARDALGEGITSTLTIVADTCDDATITAALAVIDPAVDRVIVCRAGNVGTARWIGTEAALQRHDGDVSRLWLAHTDADTRVPSSWLVQQLEHARRGAVGVAGVVHLDPSRSPSPGLVAAFGRSYLVAGDLSHAHVHGANLGMSAEAYRRAGGWRPLATGEDHDLWWRLRACGLIVTDSSLSVATDPRTVGRAPHDFASNVAAIVDDVA